MWIFQWNDAHSIEISSDRFLTLPIFRGITELIPYQILLTSYQIRRKKSKLKIPQSRFRNKKEFEIEMISKKIEFHIIT